MFPATITIHNASDLQKVMSVLYPTTGVVEITDKTRDVAPRTNDADLQATINKAESKVTTGKPKTTSAATPVDGAPGQPTAEAGAATDAPEKTAAESKPTAASATTEPQASTAAADAPALQYKDVQAAVVAAVKAGKRTEVVALLKANNVDHAEKLTPEQWPAVHAELTKLVG